ncbi:hypothetical protein [Bradyrhizobium japonicum]|uniref:hypothetical protein n=1 Tax=Bradyrhizobium japonicum TaxID=375 RepID=UPI00047F8D97|nr:hypothetical protein [Bradyrhizobium japonicum]
MTVDQKLDRILEEIAKISEQLMLMQAILLESSKLSPKSKGRRSIRTMQVVLDGCEDQSIEPSGPADDGDDGDGDGGDDGGGDKKIAKPQVVRSKRKTSSGRRK